jgi:hypothetical protein
MNKARSWKKLLLEDENIPQMVQEICNISNLLPLVQQVPDCEKGNDDIQK